MNRVSNLTGLLGALTIALLSTAGCTQKSPGNQTTDLVGKTVVHSWTEGQWAGASFSTLFCSADTLVWNNVSDPNNVSSAAETYHRSDLAPKIVQISWKESPDTTNLGLIWTLNFKSGRITGVIVNAAPDANVNVAGEFEIIDGLTIDSAAGLRGCSK